MARSIVKYIGTSAADTAQTVGAPATAGVKLRVLYVTVAYSAAPTQTGVTVAIDSGSGAGYDTTLYTGSADVRYTYWTPDTELILDSTDQLDVTAPAAGGAVTSSVLIMCEVA